MRATRTAVVVAILLLVGTRVEAQSLDAAKDLYASAEYDRSLAMLDTLKSMEHTREELQTLELYRVLCLVATGKEADARGIIEGLVTKDPLYRQAQMTALQYGAPPRAILPIYQLTKDTEGRRQKILNDATLNAQQKSQALNAVQQDQIRAVQKIVSEAATQR